MSIHDQLSLQANSVEEMALIGRSLAKSIYIRPLTISLSGELGAGKTTLVQGLAEGLGVESRITSPTFALEQRYGDDLSHIDLYRLNEKQTNDFIAHTLDFPGIRCIEWPERHVDTKADITIHIEETPKKERIVHIKFLDIEIPSHEEIQKWVKHVHLPENVQKHMAQVTNVAMKVTDLLTANGTVVRKKALEAASLTHDLLRFVDFKEWQGEGAPPSDETIGRWESLREQYGAPHEAAAENFLIDFGYPEIGKIVRPHRGFTRAGELEQEVGTIEQKILCYADKRVRFDTVVSLDERFDDFAVRYEHGEESSRAKAWRAKTKQLEKELFPEGVPF